MITLTYTTWGRLTNLHDKPCDQVDNPTVFSWNISTGAPAVLFEESASVPVYGILDAAACANWEYAQFKTRMLAQIPFSQDVQQDGCFLVKLNELGCSLSEECL
jgi:hypothetical protein